MIRALSLLVYAAVAALGEALLARPALLFVRGLGLFRPVLPWEVPLGALQLALAVAIAALTCALGLRAALEKRGSTAPHLALLLLLGAALALRKTAGEPRPPADPGPQLMLGLRAAADALDAGYRDGYDARTVDAALAALPSPGFVSRGRALPMRAEVLTGASGPLLEPGERDAPGTIYVALSADRKSAWLTARGLSRIALLASGKPAVLAARAGTHSLPGRDPLVPLYPGMRSITEKR